uniref:Endonuclease/exonuclease/phosphatase domain-containing protein n=1 Tax=Oryzias latipes TaxID=8090 RepID=A0A3P9J4I4_ORYLA
MGDFNANLSDDSSIFGNHLTSYCEENNLTLSSKILLPDTSKACGLDDISVEHLKYSSFKLLPLLAMCFTGFLTHGVLPDSILSVVLIPVIKDKTASLNKYVLLTRLEDHLLTSENQFGFKNRPRH